MRVAVTGSSGFIGSNLVERLASEGIPTLPIDLQPPRNPAHRDRWSRCDLLDLEGLKGLFLQFAPTHVIHLAARTDLRGKALSDYAANIGGVQALLTVVGACPSIERVVFVSSMLVCRAGHVPSSDTDFSPTTLYGESKVAGEFLVRKQMGDDVTWSIARPCSIWGPWFGEPYRHFFDAVLKRRFVRFGPESVKKTFGYVGNTVHQLMQFLTAPRPDVHRKVFYLGDDPPLNAGQWAMEIARVARVKPPGRIPLSWMRIAAKVGDALGAVGISAPMTSFRLGNMTTSNVMDLSATLRLAAPPFILEQGIRETIAWIRSERDSTGPA